MNILATGGAGSFGKQFVKLALKQPGVSRVVVYSRDEGKHSAMQMEGFTDPRLRFFIGDVRDRERLTLAMQGIDIVVHAAALKQVPAGEYNFSEFMATNATGTANVVKAAIACKVKKALMLSTDKACQPSTGYGVTKAAAEATFIAGNIESGQRDPIFSCVRYGNVLGSRGSVVPLWQEQAKTGTITVTDPDMTRYFLTIRTAAEFVWSSLEIMAGGEIFIPIIPSIRIDDLATMIAPGCRHEYIGVRQNEKEHESLISEQESYRGVRKIHDRYVIMPSYRLPAYDRWAEAEEMPKGFSYASNTNDRWLSEGELREMISGRM